jgi:hypothetical protein
MDSLSANDPRLFPLLPVKDLTDTGSTVSVKSVTVFEGRTIDDVSSIIPVNQMNVHIPHCYLGSDRWRR